MNKRRISRLRRALAVFLSAVMLIMCMPVVGITAAAVDDAIKCMYATITDTEAITTLFEVPAGTVWTGSEDDEDNAPTLTEALAVANADHDGDTVYIKLLSDVNKSKVTDGTLNANGKTSLEIDYGKNYTLVVEE